jgi:hypothetical protein
MEPSKLKALESNMAMIKIRLIRMVDERFFVVGKRGRGFID